MTVYRRGKDEVWYMSFTYKGKRYSRSTETTDRETVQKIHDVLRGRIAEGKWIGSTRKRENTRGAPEQVPGRGLQVESG